MKSSLRRIIALAALATVAFGSVSVFAMRGQKKQVRFANAHAVTGKGSRLRTISLNGKQINWGVAGTEIMETYQLLVSIPENKIADDEFSGIINFMIDTMRSSYRKSINSFGGDNARVMAQLTTDAIIAMEEDVKTDGFCFEHAIALVATKYTVLASGGFAYKSIADALEVKFEKHGVDFTDADDSEIDAPEISKTKALFLALGVLGSAWFLHKKVQDGDSWIGKKDFAGWLRSEDRCSIIKKLFGISAQ